MKHTAIHSQHHALGGVFPKTGDWDMPIHYGNPVQEHIAVRQGVGLADLSHRGTLTITGEDRITWLQSLISHDILPLQPGQGQYSTFMSHKGKILSYFRVYILEDHIRMEDVGEVGDTTFQAFRKFLLYGTKANMKSGLANIGVLLLSGPKAANLIQSALGLEVQNLAILETRSHVWEEESILIARTEETGETDFEIFIANSGLSSLWDLLIETGKPLGLQPFGCTSRESLRLEAGLPKLGPDLNDTLVPPEANLEGKAFSLNKGCYPGQEVVARMDTYGSVKRRLVGLIVEGEGDPFPLIGAKLFHGEREVGWISSAAFSPTLHQTIAFGFPLRDFTQPDTQLTVAFEGHSLQAVVHALPFVSKTP